MADSGRAKQFQQALCTGGESRGWELSQQRITETWFPCWGSPVRLRGRKQQQGRGSQPKALLRSADLEHILQWRKKRGKESVQVIHHVLPAAPSRVLFSSKSAWVKKTFCNTHHMCFCMSWAVEECPKSWNLAKRGSLLGWLSRVSLPRVICYPFPDKCPQESVPQGSKNGQFCYRGF